MLEVSAGNPKKWTVGFRRYGVERHARIPSTHNTPAFAETHARTHARDLLEFSPIFTEKVIHSRDSIPFRIDTRYNDGGIARLGNQKFIESKERELLFAFPRSTQNYNVIFDSWREFIFPSLVFEIFWTANKVGRERCIVFSQRSKFSRFKEKQRKKEG